MSDNILQESNISIHNPAFGGLLNNLQANILKHHGREHAWHLFMQFMPGKEKEVANWISTRLAGKKGFITSAFRQLADIEKRKVMQVQGKKKPFDGGFVTCFFISFKGYKQLGFNTTEIIGKYSFFKSLTERGPGINNLDDPETAKWEKPFRFDIHAMLLLADNNRQKLKKKVKRLKAETKGVIRIVSIQKGKILRNHNRKAIEHFGYEDGISQPSFLADDGPPGGKVWSDRMPLGIVLTKDPCGEFNDDCFGSFLVFRKLEQNVKKFNRKRKQLARSIFPVGHSRSKAKLAGAFLVGRFDDGTPVIKHDRQQSLYNRDNDFDYSAQDSESRCPLHAHIRITNPREKQADEFVRIVRRGIPYDEVGRNNDLTTYPKKGVGILFMSYQADIEKQFEQIQKWANEGIIRVGGGTIRSGIDGMVGQGNNSFVQKWPRAWDSVWVMRKNLFSKVVTMKGGEYFFAPSIAFLSNIQKFENLKS